MVQSNDTVEMLDLMVRPAFCVRDHVICQVNRSADDLLFTPGQDIRPLLLTGSEEYSAFTGGCLYLRICVSGHLLDACVTRTSRGDVFLLDDGADDAELRAMALGARALRDPLAGLVSAVNQMSAQLQPAEGDDVQLQLAQINRGIYRMLRIIGNMTDAGRYASRENRPQETVNISAFWEEFFNKYREMIAHTGISLQFSGIHRGIFTLVDKELLERAMLNILSNALKFSRPDGRILVRLHHSGKMLRLSVQDDGEGIQPQIQGSVFARYLRSPMIEDSRFGIGLGMSIIRSAAAAHGGTVLLDTPEDGGTRITLTMRIRENPQSMVHSPIFRVDYAGELDHGLIELSDVLPAHLYEPDKL